MEPKFVRRAARAVAIPLWEFVLRKLSEKLLEEGAASSRDLLNLENAECSAG